MLSFSPHHCCYHLNKKYLLKLNRKKKQHYLYNVSLKNIRKCTYILLNCFLYVSVIVTGVIKQSLNPSHIELEWHINRNNCKVKKWKETCCELCMISRYHPLLVSYGTCETLSKWRAVERSQPNSSALNIESSWNIQFYSSNLFLASVFSLPYSLVPVHLWLGFATRWSKIQNAPNVV